MSDSGAAAAATQADVLAAVPDLADAVQASSVGALADARSDPLREALDPTQARAATAAYARGRRTLGAGRPAASADGGRMRGLFLSDDSAFVRAGAARPRATVGGLLGGGGAATASDADAATALRAAPVSEEALARLRATYVRGSAYPRLGRVLAERRLVVLRGAPGSGRTATALHLLDHATDGRVSRLAGEIDPSAVGAALLEPGRGYLLELDRANAPILDDARLHQLSALLGARGCHLVLVVDTHPRFRGPLAGFAVDAPAADARTVLARHTASATASEPDPVRVRAAELLEEPAVTGALDDGPALSEVAYRAQQLVRVARGELTYPAFLREAAESVRQLAASWFAGLHDLSRGNGGEEALRTAAFRIALATLDGLPYHLVAEAGELLAWEMIITAWPHRAPGRPPFGLDPRTRLAPCRARLVTGLVEVGDLDTPVELAEFVDESLAAAVLDHVWRTHHNLRKPLTRWLQDLGADPRAIVWVRAAQAAGLLCSLDFSYGYEELIGPWAGSDLARRRMFAAIALDQAGADERVRPVVRQLLRDWARGRDAARRWTAAVALRRELGLAVPDYALDELLVVGAWPAPADPELTRLAADGVAALLAGGAVRPVLGRLAAWLGDTSSARRELAMVSLIRLADLRASHAGPCAPHPAAGRERWPLLLLLADTEPALAGPIAELLRALLRGGPAQPAALAALADWLRAAAGDPSCQAALAAFTPRLVADKADARRLRLMLDDLAHDWVDPADPGLLAQLGAVLDRMSPAQGSSPAAAGAGGG